MPVQPGGITPMLMSRGHEQGRAEVYMMRGTGLRFNKINQLDYTAEFSDV